MYIHQTLHGYQHGHNKLNSSIILPPIDEDRMKILSDWSEYVQYWSISFYISKNNQGTSDKDR